MFLLYCFAFPLCVLIHTLCNNLLTVSIQHRYIIYRNVTFPSITSRPFYDKLCKQHKKST